MATAPFAESADESRSSTDALRSSALGPQSSVLGPRSSVLVPLWLPVASLLWREVVRFYRQPSRVIGGLASPLVFWLLIGSGLDRSFQHPAGGPSMRYIEYFFPGTLAMILLFTAIFSMVSIIEDRREGFLQAVLVSPISPAGVVLAKILGGTTLASLQGFLFLVLAPLAGVQPTALGWLAAAAMIVLVAFAMAGLGFLAAWPMESTQGFHSIMNLVLLPLWLLSGALFPAQGAAAPVRWVMRLNPVSYGVEGLRSALYWPQADAAAAIEHLLLCALVTTIFGAGTFAASIWMAARRAGGPR